MTRPQVLGEMSSMVSMMFMSVATDSLARHPLGSFKEGSVCSVASVAGEDSMAVFVSLTLGSASQSLK